MSIVFHRLVGRSKSCVLCPEDTENESRVVISFVRERSGAEMGISLCPKHEHELLERLVGNL